MTESTRTISVVYQSGVFVPETDVAYLQEGSRFNLNIWPAPDEWDELLEEIISEETRARVAEGTALPPSNEGRWGMLSPDVARLVIESDDLLVWNLETFRETGTPLL